MKKRNYAALSFVALMALGFASGCSKKSSDPVGPKEVDGVKIWALENTQTALADEEVPEGVSSTLSLYALKGETESAQLILTPDHDVKKYVVAVSDLVNTSDKSSIIGKDDIEILAERYIETKQSSTTHPVTSEEYAGYYPDALIPFAKCQKKLENKMYANQNQGVWFNVNIPRDAASGTYEGTVTLTIDGTETTVKMTLRVYDAAIPEEYHTQASYGLWYDYFKYANVSTDQAILDNYYNFLVSKRATPADLPLAAYVKGGVPTAKEYVDGLLAYAANNKQVPSYNIAYTVDSTEEYGIMTDETYLNEVLTEMIERNIALRKSGDTTTNLFKKAYYYDWRTVDEPYYDESDPAGTNYQIRRIKKSDLMFVNAKNSLKSRLDAYPDLQESFLAVPHIVTTSPDRTGFQGGDDTGGVQTWCIKVYEYDSQSFRDLVDYRRTNPLNRMNGEDFWWYTCNEPGNPYPTYHIDDNLLSARVQNWMQYDYDMSGFLFWCVNFWRKCMNYDSGKYEDRDVWNDPCSFYPVNGEGSLIYPGNKYGLDQPISTIRLETIREGGEDYEYLYMIEKRIDEINSSLGKSYDSDEILGNYYSRLYNGTVVNGNKLFAEQLKICETFRDTRNEVLTLLEQLYESDDAAVNALDSLGK